MKGEGRIVYAHAIITYHFSLITRPPVYSALVSNLPSPVTLHPSPKGCLASLKDLGSIPLRNGLLSVKGPGSLSDGAGLREPRKASLSASLADYSTKVQHFERAIVLFYT